MASNEILKVTDEFIQQNSEYPKIKKRSKSGGPYSKNEKDVRREEVRRLHFDYGYSGRKIAELMKVNRNTVNGDVDYLYSKIRKDANIINPGKTAALYLGQLNIQRARLREQLDKVTSNSERMAIERLIYDITSKIIHSFQKLADSEYRVHKRSTILMNDFMEKNDNPNRYVSYYDTISVSQKAQERIWKIIKEDRQHVN